MNRPASRRLELERLETRELLAANPIASLSPAGVLRVEGTVRADAFRISQTRGALVVAGVRVLHNGVYKPYVPASLVRRVDVFTLNGNDVVNVRGVARPLIINGGVGSDRFRLDVTTPAQLPGFAAGDRIEFGTPAAVRKTVVLRGYVWVLEAGGRVRVNGVATAWTNMADLTVDRLGRLVLRDRGNNLFRSAATNGAGGLRVMATQFLRWQFTATGQIVALQSNGQVRVDGVVTAQFDPTRLLQDGQGAIYAFSPVTHSVWQWAQSGFVEASGRDIAQVAVDGLGNLHALSFNSRSIWRRNGWSWSEVSSRDISQMAVSGGTLYALSFTSKSVWQRIGSSWSEVSGRDITRIGVDRQGILYALSSVSRSIWQRNWSGWTEVSGRDIAEMGVDKDGGLYALSFVSQSVWQRSSSSWFEVSARDITHMGVDGQGVLYALSSTSHSVLQRNWWGWSEASGRDISQMGVDRLGNVQALSFASKSVWQRSGSGWFETTGRDITRMGVDRKGDVYALSFVSRSVWQQVGSGFVEVSGRDLSQLGVDKHGDVYALSFVSNSVWQRSSTGWFEASGRDISQMGMDKQGDLFALSSVSKSVWQRSESGWFEATGRDISQLAVDGIGNVLALSFASNSVWQRTASGFVEVTGRDIAQMAVDGTGTVYLRGTGNQLWSSSPSRWTQIDSGVGSLTAQLDGSLSIVSNWRGASLPVMDANRYAVRYRNTEVQFDTTNWAPDGYKASHINQAESGICVFAASLASAAARGRSFANRIQYLGNNRYNVFLYEAGWQQVYFDGTVYKEDLQPLTTKVTINGREVTRLTSYWALLVARAYLQYQAHVDWSRDPGPDSTWYQGGLFHGNRPPFMSPKNALYAIAGGDKNNWDTDESVAQEMMLRSLQLRNPVIVTTEVGKRVRDANGNPTGQVSKGGHAFAVLDMYQQNGQWMVSLMNPWNNPQEDVLVKGNWFNWGATFTITWNQLRTFFDPTFTTSGADPS